MINVLILGASGQIARHVINFLLADTNVQLTLFVRHTRKLRKTGLKHVKIIQADVLDTKKLKESMHGQDIVYANLEGDLDKMARRIVRSMMSTGIKRLIFITSIGIYDEVPGAFGEWNNKMLGQYLVTYRKAADIIEKSSVDYTILRPAWLTDHDEVDYEITQKGQPFKGTEVSRKSVAALVVKLILTPGLQIRKSLGVNKPNTDGDKPKFYKKKK